MDQKGPGVWRSRLPDTIFFPDVFYSGPICGGMIWSREGTAPRAMSHFRGRYRGGKGAMDRPVGQIIAEGRSRSGLLPYQVGLSCFPFRKRENTLGRGAGPGGS